MPFTSVARRRYLSLVVATLALAAASPAGASGPDPAAARAAFERFVALEGTWQAASTAGWDERVTYEVIARGSVVMSTTTFRDAPDRTMVTMIHLDGDRLVLTHYCEARNQPHLVADEIAADGSSVLFRFAGGGNIPDRDHGHMDSAVYRFLPDGTMSSRWTWYQDGDEQWLEDITSERVR